MTNEVVERRKLWLSWLELPWDVVRDDLIGEMHRVNMRLLSPDDLPYADGPVPHPALASSHQDESNHGQQGPSSMSDQIAQEIVHLAHVGLLA
jgi:hypothetical protein